MPYVDSDGWQVWYEVTGSGPPLVCSGGMIMMHDQFARVRAGLAEHFTVIDWNHRGAGQSERTSIGGFTFGDFMRDLQRVLEAANVKRAHHWGGSTGSLMAIRHAARHPDAVDRLVLWPTWQTGPYDPDNAYSQIARNTGIEGVISRHRCAGVRRREGRRRRGGRGAGARRAVSRALGRGRS